MTAESEPSGRVLRDYLYVDVDKVKSIAGQLESGVPEETRLTSKDAQRTTMGWRAFLSYSPESSEEGYVQRSMLDSLFPELEDILEHGWLEDISEDFQQTDRDVFKRVQSRRPEGSLFRLTADGYLFDVRHFASLFANVATALGGYQEFEKAVKDLAATMAAQQAGAAPKKERSPKGSCKDGQRQGGPALDRLEDAIEEFAPQYGMSPAFLRSMVRTARGVFSPGLHLLMENEAAGQPFNVTARLQNNGRYLDASPEVVASRYGVKAQRWTIVGTVGHYSMEPAAAGLASLSIENELADDFNRLRFVRTLNSSVSEMAESGMIDLPQHPGMAAVPIAVYRAVRGGPHLLTPQDPARPAGSGARGGAEAGAPTEAAP